MHFFHEHKVRKIQYRLQCRGGYDWAAESWLALEFGSTLLWDSILPESDSGSDSDGEVDPWIFLRVSWNNLRFSIRVSLRIVHKSNKAQTAARIAERKQLDQKIRNPTPERRSRQTVWPTMIKITARQSQIQLRTLQNRDGRKSTCMWKENTKAGESANLFLIHCFYNWDYFQTISPPFKIPHEQAAQASSSEICFAWSHYSL